MQALDQLIEQYKVASQSDPVTYAVPVFVVFIAIEIFLSIRQKLNLYETKEAAASIAMGVGVAILGVGLKFAAFVMYLLAYQYAPESWKTTLSMGHWYSWVLLVFADDFIFYWYHRMSHSVRVFWAAHETHHSAKTLNLAVALRQSWTEPLYKFFMWVPLALVGFHPIAILMMMSFSLIYQFFMHTETVYKLGPLEWVLNTPSHHRVHHATNIQYLDRNHAGMLIIWDRLFGTFIQEQDDEKPVYGTRKGVYHTNPFKIASHELIDLWQDVRRARSMRDAINYVVQPPGWQPGDTSQMTKSLQARLRNGEAVE